MGHRSCRREKFVSEQSIGFTMMIQTSMQFYENLVKMENLLTRALTTLKAFIGRTCAPNKKILSNGRQITINGSVFQMSTGQMSTRSLAETRSHMKTQNKAR